MPAGGFFVRQARADETAAAAASGAGFGFRWFQDLIVFCFGFGVSGLQMLRRTLPDTPGVGVFVCRGTCLSSSQHLRQGLGAHGNAARHEVIESNEDLNQKAHPDRKAVRSIYV